MRFAKIVLRVIGAATLGFGLLSLLSPAALSDPAGFGALAPSALTDLRATYGGFQLGSGLFLLWAAGRAEAVRSALVLLALSIGCVGLSRGYGMLVDGSANGFHLFGIATEASIALLALFALRSAAPAAARPA